ncbi:hypothetical protein BTHERMOSOX_1427 [Bathymodiolus thermophilus thioautotrophic gill symbiont]|uniref:Preprotein translocase subunit YajC n=1 Tax=Bathymodiolus thermophilus thioautotrophic gill symbiont TaxID=2360 RepID=A0A1J5TW71_9GAMM|nr:PP0621 family protein [Bathymodiolus thermophilus thioautotrophic gill symbiont]OIR24444.1 hypothetical protein BGC33_10515 [Bathymodiolus thermophilus thioautotrophic gill symbiont]CAB5505010.1 hypothetical protein THERMOT_2070 [Bathymodiolus thermophilus thioautotrophic gill symbiont]SGZ75355.1 hypothetical protein BTHERMOSOX_1427 [Bathymodiolus thermophilus thioautotrophic gill symbiont]
MGIIKVLPFVLLAVGMFLVFKKIRQVPSEMTTKSPSRKMLGCCVCETHIPEREAIMYRDKVYCSETHLKQGLGEDE